LIDLDNGDYGRPVTGDAAGLSFKKMRVQVMKRKKREKKNKREKK